MNKYIAFIRGINVGGIVLKMEEVGNIFIELGYKNVETYIQSGNILFDCNETDTALMERKIQGAIKAKSDLNVVIFVKIKDEIQRLISNSPFGKDVDEKRIYVIMLNQVLTEEKAKKVKSMNSEEEKFIAHKDVIYSYYDNGYGKSKHNNNYFEKILNVSATTRNWNTMNRILEIMKSRGVP